MATRKVIPKERKIFLNCMNSWLSNFIIEEFRTDYLPEAKTKNIFMGTIDLSGRPLPALFEPKETTVEIGYNYNQEVFQNDVFIYNLDDSNLSEVEFVIRGLQTIKYDNEKILILISNIMTWADTPIKTFTEEEINKEGFDEEEVPEIQDDFLNNKEKNEIVGEKSEINEEDKKSDMSKASKDTKSKHKESKDNNENKDKNNNNKESKKELDKMNNEIMKDKENSTIKLDQSAVEQLNPNKDNIEEQLKKQEKPKIKTYYYKETEYEKRIPNSRFFYYKILESLALTKNNPNLKSYIICPGFIYGCGEDIFYDYFKECWLKKIEYMPLIGDGENHIPTIHILDLIQVIKRIINLRPEVNYIYACDKTKNPTLKNILQSISRGIGSIDIKMIKDFNISEINLPHYTELNIDLRIKNSSIMEDEPRRQKEDLEDYNERKFPWHCEFGIPENMSKLLDEFNLYRDLKPAKILILGPPYGGKSTVAKIISEKYNISHLTIDKICEWIKKEKSPLGDEVRQKIEEMEENMTKAMDEYEHRKNKKKTDPPFDPVEYKKFSNDLLGKIIKNKLNEGECLGKGYILENFPKNYEDCINIFSDTPYDKEKKEEEIVYEINKNLLPDSVIIINNYKEESLKNKLKLKYPDYSERQNELDFKYNRRLTNYKHFEEINDDNKKLITDFFTENGVDIFYIDEEISLENNNEENQKIFEYLERNGPIDNAYKLFDEEEINIFDGIKEIINKEEKKDDINEKDENENDENKNISENNKEEKDDKKDENQNIEEEKMESKEKSENKNEENKNEENKTKSIINENEGENNGEEKKMSNMEISKEEMNENEKIQQKLNEIRDREISLLEKKSEILRRYLSENVLPLLAKGVLYVCQNMPDDPVEALANYLLDNSLNLSKVKDNNHNKTESELEKIINETLS